MTDGKIQFTNKQGVQQIKPLKPIKEKSNNTEIADADKSPEENTDKFVSSTQNEPTPTNFKKVINSEKANRLLSDLDEFATSKKATTNEIDGRIKEIIVNIARLVRYDGKINTEEFNNIKEEIRAQFKNLATSLDTSKWNKEETKQLGLEVREFAKRFDELFKVEKLQARIRIEVRSGEIKRIKFDDSDITQEKITEAMRFVQERLKTTIPDKYKLTKNDYEDLGTNKSKFLGFQKEHQEALKLDNERENNKSKFYSDQSKVDRLLEISYRNMWLFIQLSEHYRKEGALDKAEQCALIANNYRINIARVEGQK